MSRPLNADELMWCDWFESLGSADERQRYVSHVPFVEGAKRERDRIRQALRSIALNSPDLRLNLSLGEIDAICPKEPSDG